jgi:predicted AAA+ superfamily ATPase
MQRLYFDKLLNWKKSKHRKPLLLQGARQVGKTWLMKEFGKEYFKNVAYVNFDKSERLRSIFTGDFNIKRIIEVIELETTQSIDPDNTLLIFDEIQEAKNGLTILKYFCEDAPQYHIMAAGSLLGIAINPAQSFPVGKIDFLKIYPLTFEEFLLNYNEQKILPYLQNNDWMVLEPFHEKLIGLLRLYYYLGGMPEVVARFIENKNYIEAREIQLKILFGYENDFAKHAPAKIIPRIRMIWNAVVSQLAKENKKFIYGLIKEGARAKEFETALNWLENYGLIYRVYRTKKANFPLAAYSDLSAFKLYVLDVGLLGTLGNLNPQTILEKEQLFTEFKGALTEQFVLQELKATDQKQLFYWANDTGSAEIDFIFESHNTIIPLEVKASENLQAKSLKTFALKHPEIHCYKTSLSDYREESWMTNVPLYGVCNLINNVS